MAITTLGHNHIAKRLGYTPDPNPMVYIAVGTGTPTSTALGAEVAKKFFTASVTGGIITYTGYWDIDDDLIGDITEAGIFNADDVMLCSQSFTAISMGESNNLTITWNLTA